MRNKRIKEKYIHMIHHYFESPHDGEGDKYPPENTRYMDIHQQNIHDYPAKHVA